VNPLTGEGIDYALESGQIAAEHLIAGAPLTAYDHELRGALRSSLSFSERVRDWYLSSAAVERTGATRQRASGVAALLRARYSANVNQRATASRRWPRGYWCISSDSIAEPHYS